MHIYSYAKLSIIKSMSHQAVFTLFDQNYSNIHEESLSQVKILGKHNISSLGVSGLTIVMKIIVHNSLQHIPLKL